jgi:hypothetical protein
MEGARASGSAIEPERSPGSSLSLQLLREIGQQAEIDTGRDRSGVCLSAAVAAEIVRAKSTSPCETEASAPTGREIGQGWGRPIDLDKTNPFFPAGIVFIDENGEGPGVRLRKRLPKKPGSK